MPTPKVTLKPEGLVDKDGHSLLTNLEVHKLLRFVWTGVFLSTTKEEYMNHTNMKTDDYNRLKEYIDPLLLVHATCKNHCVVFKNDTYKTIVDLADSMYALAQKAGGKEAGSYYANILKDGKILFEELDKDIADQNQTVISNKRTVINALLRGDQKALKEKDKIINDKLAAEGGDIDTLTTTIAAKIKEIDQDQDEFEQDVIIAATTAAYATVFPVGTICAAVVLGVYTERAVVMKVKIDALKEILQNDQDKLASDNMLVAGLKLMDKDLSALIALIGPAITVIDEMVGAWGIIAADLKAVKDAVAENSDETDLPELQEISQEGVLSAWNDLKVEVNNFRQAAYISDPDQVTLDDYSRQLQASIDGA
ncbi:predicted protein [Sclerotinia sclerotiorum 1980 UF-70]|uniref:Uncharacterized protein n=1 Tax=Sclerotinia sclerotiorum (strain ATCC 18683 / 1980 / Ss-1) TaxID=665079 RepID=A7EIL7_SCLS1|nr:predicted protein [Sclerotinia sclerotiorum 1980 UF-70]EDO02683.1 predicted protein [Sclerotinia sclerotiorum 1980 UF-70]